MWVHPDISESQQWTTVTHKKSEGKAKAFSSNVVGIYTRETEKDVTSLTSSTEEESPWLLIHVLLPRRRPDLASST